MTHRKLADKWLRRLECDRLPVLGRTVGLLENVDNFEEAHQNRITQAIMSDAGMTTRVLRLANSVPFARQRQMRSLARAIMCLGCQTIQALAISAAILEGLEDPCRQVICDFLARGVQRAVVAREVAAACREENCDEAYVAGLLYELGQMLVLIDGWERDRKVMDLNGSQWRAIPFDQITRQLARQWQLSPVIPEVLSGAVRSALGRAVEVSEQIVQAWADSLPDDEISVVWPDAFAVPVEDRVAWLEQVRRLATTAVERSGLELPSQQVAMDSGVSIKAVNHTLLLDLLADLVAMGREGTLDLNRLLQMLVEGVHRAVGFGTVAVCLGLPGKDMLEMRWLLGDKAERLRQLLAVKRDVVYHDPLLCRVWQDGQWLLSGRRPVDGMDGIWRAVEPMGLLKTWQENWVAIPLRYQSRTLAVILAGGHASASSEALRAAALLVEQAELCLRAQGA